MAGNLTPTMPAEGFYSGRAEIRNEQFDSLLDKIGNRWDDLHTEETREDGNISPKTMAIALGVGAVLGFILTTGGGAYSIDQKSSYTKASITKIEAVAFACRAVVDADIVSHARNKLTLAGVQVPSTGFEASMEGVAQMTVCMEDPQVDTKVINGTKKQVVTIDLASLVFKTGYDENRTKVTQQTPDVSNLGEGISSIIGGFTNGFSDPLMENHIQAEQANIEQAVRVSGIKTMETDCSQAGWKLIVNAIDKSYDQQAIKQKLDPADVSVVLKGKHPNWNKLYKASHPSAQQDGGKFGYSMTIDNHSCKVSPAVEQVADISEPGATSVQ